MIILCWLQLDKCNIIIYLKFTCTYIIVSFDFVNEYLGYWADIRQRMR